MTPFHLSQSGVFTSSENYIITTAPDRAMRNNVALCIENLHWSMVAHNMCLCSTRGEESKKNSATTRVVGLHLHTHTPQAIYRSTSTCNFSAVCEECNAMLRAVNLRARFFRLALLMNMDAKHTSYCWEPQVIWHAWQSRRTRNKPACSAMNSL